MIRPAAWTQRNEAFIASALATADLADIKYQVQNGARLFDVIAVHGGQEAAVGAFVLRVDRQACKNVGVVVAAGGGACGIDLTAQLMPHIERMFIGCAAVRVHTERPGLVRKLAKQGYGATEYVLERSL